MAFIEVEYIQKIKQQQQTFNVINEIRQFVRAIWLIIVCIINHPKTISMSQHAAMPTECLFSFLDIPTNAIDDTATPKLTFIHSL